MSRTPTSPASKPSNLWGIFFNPSGDADSQPSSPIHISPVRRLFTPSPTYTSIDETLTLLDAVKIYFVLNFVVPFPSLPPDTKYFPKPHHLLFKKDGTEEKEIETDIRNLGQVLAGWRCFILSTCAKSEEEETFWWTLGETYGDYQCIDRLNCSDRQRINQAITGNPLTSHEIERMLWRIHRAAQLHGTVGYGMLAETLFLLCRYHHKRLLAWQDALKEVSSPLPSVCHFRTHYRELPQKGISMWNPFEKFIEQRNEYCRQAIIYMQVAILLEPSCSNLTYNATGDKGIFQICTWRRQDIHSLEGMLTYYCDYYDRICLSQPNPQNSNSEDLRNLGIQKANQILTTQSMDSSLNGNDWFTLSPRTF